jgi:hypothetical protein
MQSQPPTQPYANVYLVVRHSLLPSHALSTLPDTANVAVAAVYHSLANAQAFLTRLKSMGAPQGWRFVDYDTSVAGCQLGGLWIVDTNGRRVESVSVREERFGDACAAGGT